MTTNHASDGDQVAVQIGRAGGRRRRDEHQADDTAGRTVTNTNIATGNAKVGVQADTVEGVLIINF